MKRPPSAISPQRCASWSEPIQRFGDKRVVQERVLERHVERGFRDRVGRIEHHMRPRGAIAAFLEEIFQFSGSDPHGRGCLIVDSTRELAPRGDATTFCRSPESSSGNSNCWSTLISA